MLEELKFEPDNKVDEEDDDCGTWTCKNNACSAKIYLDNDDKLTFNSFLSHECPPCLKMKLENYIKIGKYFFDLLSEDKQFKIWKCRNCDLTLQTDMKHFLMKCYNKKLHKCKIQSSCQEK